MKTFMKTSALVAFLLAFCVLIPSKALAKTTRHITFQTFYDELSPYGEWVHNPQHGYVWLPYAEPGFQPYATRGHWVMTEYGNTWVSDYRWGWAPFHYGRWFYDDFYGWAWIPGQEWGPAWVHWRTGNGYYGWAPLGPGAHFHVNIHIPVNHWVFVPHAYITHRHVYNHYIPRTRVVNVYHQSVVINNVHTTNNYTYIAGPSRREVERVTKRRVAVRAIDNSSKPDRAVVSNSRVRLYRPAVNSARESARPSRVATRENSRRQTSDSPARTSYTREGGRTNSSANRAPSVRTQEPTRSIGNSSRNQPATTERVRTNSSSNVRQPQRTSTMSRTPARSSSNSRVQQREAPQKQTTVRQQSNSRQQSSARQAQPKRSTQRSSNGRSR